jgi:hypothetical protein
VNGYVEAGYSVALTTVTVYGAALAIQRRRLLRAVRRTTASPLTGEAMPTRGVVEGPAPAPAQAQDRPGGEL